MELQIFKLDSDKPILKLNVGTHKFGRGGLLQCNDKRVSRNHGILNITQDAVTITSTHINPCFYQAANSKNIVLLSKDTSVEISDGDKFALLPDDYWYRIKINQPDGGETAKCSTSMNGLLANDDFKQTPGPSRDFNDIELPKPSTSACTLPPWLQTVTLDAEEETKRNINAVNEAVMEMKESIARPSLVNNTLRDAILVQQEDNKANTVQIPCKRAHESETTPNTKKPKVEENDVKTDVYPDEQPSSAKPEVVSDSDDNAENEATNVTEVVEIYTANYKGDEETREKDATPSGSKNSAKCGAAKEWRDRCWYGPGCYRKNPKHRKEYRHVGDSDYDSDPNDDRPTCSFGGGCYRRNKDHRKNYKHPSAGISGVPPPPQRRKKRKPKNPTGVAAPAQNNSSDEDDYDFYDPFIDDGSEDEYIPDTISSEESDTEGSSMATFDSQEDTKRLVKEAKRFTRKKD